jgi:hypothetical protein
MSAPRVGVNGASQMPCQTAQLRASALSIARERHALRQLLRACGNERITPLVLKGFALAYTVYEKPWARPHSDIDVLVPAGRLLDVVQLAESLGYTRSVASSDAAIRGQYELTSAGALPITIDVHGRLFNPRVFDRVEEYDALAARAQPVPAIDPLARALGTVDALLHALVHRVAHHYRSDDPVWLMDIHLLAGRLDAERWTELRDRARQWRVGAIVVDGLLAARAMFGTDIGDAGRWSFSCEPTRLLVEGRPTEWLVQRLSFAQVRGTRSKWRLVRAHAFPPAPYMFTRYATTRKWRLPELYARRMGSAALRSLRTWIGHARRPSRES